MLRPERQKEIRRLLSATYQPGAEGPTSFDCFGLTRYVQRLFFGRELPLDRAADRARWARVDMPLDGDIVLMGSSGDQHIGTFLEGGVVLHAVEPAGWAPGDRRPAVSADAISTLRIRGFSNLRFYRSA